jgi:Uma2 family endonuclease
MRMEETTFTSDELFTQAEFERFMAEGLLPSDIHRYELIRGRIVMSPAASAGHGAVEHALQLLIGMHVREHALGRVFGSSTGLALPTGDTLEPDLCFVSHARLAAAQRRIGRGFLVVVPELVIEVLSPSTARRDRTEKLDIYGRSGVHECWIVDPEARRVRVFDGTGHGFAEPRAHERGAVVSRVFPTLALAVEDVFEPLDDE